ncbi:RagB/SusD family nutrient uptake outer membrane protein [Arachidicoccus soli]|uniref:RagB/SusD family nutrient uptake outer membrane protein n=1 Tax=Arachidicoccus soli TaxID=2341117 RepID=A0A386HT21_9BACT|nr:RagB/SusD family nutrient uptake outer membrane protein [Arachidicoccus soli]AYD48656.1 RagB/SusD family nutrient uptake outer membrane protein [Arachidicoccus soli]
MKQNNYIRLLVILMAVAFTSCQKGFLDRTPKTAISDAEFWKSPNDLRLYCNNFYNNYLPSYRGYNTWGPYSLDDYQGSDNLANKQYSQYILNGESITPSSSDSWSWSDIRNVNYFLQNYSKVNASWSAIQQYVGEALFFKSMLYFAKLQNFGDLPWYNKPLGVNDTLLLKAPRISRAIIADSIIKNLDSAIAYLPSKAVAEPMRVNKEVALALQARIALYEGTWEKYHAGTPFGVQGSTGTSFLQKAASASQLIIDGGLYGLDNVGVPFGYWKLFNQTDYSSSKEVMLWRKFDQSQGIYTLWSAYEKLGGGRGVTKSLVDAYLCKDGQPIAVSSLYKGDDSLKGVIANRDPRLSGLIQVNDGQHFVSTNVPFYAPAFTGANEDKNYTGYQLYKGLNIDPAQQNNSTGGTDGVIYFRYAEVLLINAEAKAELGTITQTDIDNTINKLRDRVGMAHLNMNAITPDPNWKFPTLSPLINEIRRERRVELACEGYRHDDIWRWNAAKQLIVGWRPKGAKYDQFVTMKGADGKPAFTASNLALLSKGADGYVDIYFKTPAMANGYQFQLDRDYLSPIPLDQITLNPNLTQNPGWGTH